MNPEEYQNLSENLTLAGAVSSQAADTSKQQYYFQEENRSIAEMQLEVETILTKCYHLLRQDRLQIDNKTRMETWVGLKDETKRVLTDEGVDKIMQTMSFYVNKENLLSNFEDKIIQRIMLTFRLALNGNLFMKYKQIFREPTLEECKEILEKRLAEKRDIKVFAAQILNLKYDEEEIERIILKETEKKVEEEIQKIRSEKRRENLMEWELLLEQLSQIVLATLNRAWKGEERGSIRRHTQISEVLGKTQAMKKDEGGMFSWGKR